MSDIKMQGEYKGYQIEWRDYPKGFMIIKEGVEVRDSMTSPEACQQWIDHKTKQKFKRVAVLERFGYRDTRMPAEATSVIEEKYVWVSSGTGRKKEEIKNVWLDTPENRQAIDAIDAKNKEVTKLREEIFIIENSTARLTADMMIDE